jgi:hypothetical protein
MSDSLIAVILLLAALLLYVACCRVAFRSGSLLTALARVELTEQERNRLALLLLVGALTVGAYASRGTSLDDALAAFLNVSP